MKSFRPTMIASIVASTFTVTALGTANAAQEPLTNFDASSQASQKILAETSQKALAVRTTTSGMKGHYDASLGKATFVWQGVNQAKPDMELISPELQNEYAADYYLNALTGISSDKNSSIKAILSSMHDLNRGAIVAKFKQEIHGVEVFNREYNVMMDREHNLVAGSGYLSNSGQASDFSILANFATPEIAIRKAFKDLGNIDVSLTPKDKVGGYTRYEAQSLDDSKVILGTPRAKKVFFEVNGKLTAAYYVEAEISDKGSVDSQYYSYVIEANGGKTFFRKNLSSHATDFNYRVYANADGYPWEGPHGDVIPAVSANQTDKTEILDAPIVSLSYYSALSTRDAWLADDATTTSGNNVFAYADVVAPQDFSDGDFAAEVTSSNTFDYPYKKDQVANSFDNRKAAIVNLFYMNNFLHDFFYDHGFNETSFVAQKSNYGRGGLEDDAIHAQAQDNSGLNNANMSTPADGANPRMQMYLYDSKDAKVGIDFGATVTSHTDIALLQSTQVSSFGQRQFSGVTGDVIRLIDGTGIVNDGCEAATNGADLAGKVAIIDRGGCAFTTKVKNAQDAGAIAAIVVNNSNDGTAAPMGGADATVTIPNVGLNFADGHAIYAKLTANETVTLDMFNKATLKDGTFDNGIIAHEWGHYISNRLVGNSSGLSNFQGRAMGEGWGDFHSLMFIAKASDINIDGNDKFQKAYGSGTFVEDFYSGIRRLPYSTDTDVNALSFRHITDGAGADIGIPGTSVRSPHAAGEIWATMLWESYVALINKHGFETAQSRMADYLVAGYKMTPIAPLYTEARDAILAAAYASDPEDYKLIISAFAKRGMGLGAVSPSRFSNDLTGVVESDKTQLATYNVKSTTFNANYDGVELGYCSNDNILDKGETGSVTVTIINTGSEALSGVKGKLVVTSGQNVTLENDGEFTFGDMQPFATATSNAIQITLNDAGTADTLELSVSFPEQEIDDAIVEALSSTLSATVNVAFEKRQPVGNADTDIMEDVSYTNNWKEMVLHGGDRAKGTQGADNGGNIGFFSGFGFNLGTQAMKLENNGFQSDVTVETMPFEVGFAGDFEMSFWHFYGLEESWDGGVIEIKLNGGDWVDVTKFGTFDVGYNTTKLNTNPTQALQERAVFSGRNGNLSTTAGNMERINFGTALNGNQVQLRFRVSSDSNSSDLGWWIDNVKVSNIVSPIYSNIIAGDAITACSNVLPKLTVANSEITITESATGQLSVAATDRNNDTLTYSWAQVSGPDATITDADKAQASFTPPSITEDSQLVFEVTVNDGTSSVSSQVTANVTNETPPAPTPAPTPAPKSSGGSTGLLTLLLLPLAIFRRRFSK